MKLRNGKRLSLATKLATVMLSALLILSAAFGIAGLGSKGKVASAKTDVAVIKLDNGNGGFSATGLSDLMKKIGSSVTGTYDALDSVFGNDFTSGSGKKQPGGTARKDASALNTTVTLGGYKWNVVLVSRALYGKSDLSDKVNYNYGSNAVGDKDDIIVTLWLADTTVAEAGIDTANYNWSAGGWSYKVETIQTANGLHYPTNMYSSSYIRALLNGTNYADYGIALGTSEQVAKGATKANPFNSVVIRDGSSLQKDEWKTLISTYGDYIATPAQIKWQQEQHESETDCTGNSWVAWGGDAPNSGLVGTDNNWYQAVYDNEKADGYTGTATAPGYVGESYQNYPTFGNVHDGTNYSAWGNDKIWLPSLFETGYNESSTGNPYNRVGLWDTTKDQRSHTGAQNVWLRSGVNADANYAGVLTPAGVAGGAYVSVSYAVRPALHLNLKSAAQAAGGASAPAKTGNAVLTYNGNEQDGIKFDAQKSYINKVEYTDKTGNKTVAEYKVNVASGEVTLAKVTYTASGGAEVAVRSADWAKYTSAWKINNNEGIVSGVNAGTYKVSAGLRAPIWDGSTKDTNGLPSSGVGGDSHAPNYWDNGGGNYSTGLKEASFEITQANVSSASITGINETYSYAGAPIEPKPVVAVQLGSDSLRTMLLEGVDYTVSYSPDHTHAGSQVTVTVTGIGDFTGTTSVQFSITKAKPTVTDVKVAPGAGPLYDGAYAPALTCFAYFTPEGSTVALNVAGKIELDDEKVYKSKTTYNWTFTPSDTTDLDVVTGTTTITVTDAVVVELSASLKDANYIIYTDTTLETLKEQLTVTAHYSNGGAKTTTDFELRLSSGTKFSAGTQTVYVQYNGTDKDGNLHAFELTVTVVKHETVLNVASVKTEYEYNGYDQSINSGALITSGNSSDNITYKIGAASSAVVHNAGVYELVISVAESDDYYGASVTLTVTVNKATLTLTANNKTIYYGDKPTNDGYTQGNYKGSDNFGNLSGVISYSYNYSQYAAVGDYTITISGVYSDNYDITFIPGKLTVEKKQVNVEWEGDKFIADGNAHAPVATFVNVFGERVTLTVTISGTTVNSGKAIVAGSYSAEVTNNHPNYNLQNTTHNFEIEEKEVEVVKQETKITFTAGNYVYTGSEQTINSGATTNRNDGNAGIIYSINGGEPKFTNAGTYTLTISVAASETYEAATITVTITVKKAPLTLTAKNATITYGDEPKNDGFNHDSSQVLGSDDINTITAGITYTYNYAKYGAVGNYSIILGGVTSDNYDITFVAGTLTVNKKEVSVVWDGDTFVADGTAHAPVATFKNVYGEMVILTVSITGENNTDGKAIEAGSYQAEVANTHPNYDLKNTTHSFKIEEKKAEVVKKETKITFTAGDYVYTGSEQTINSGATTNRGDEQGTITYSINGGEPKFTNAGTYTLTISVAASETYEAATITVTITVKKAPLTLTANNATITYGEDPKNDGFSYEQTQVLGSDDINTITAGLTYSYNYAQYGAVGKYSIILSGVTSENYEITFVPGTLTVNKKEVSVVWDGDTFAADGKAHAPVAWFTNVYGEMVILTVTVSGTNASDGKAIQAGDYTAEVANTHPNYTFKAETLTHSFKIEEQKVDTKKDTIITFTGTTEYTYNGSEQEITSGATTNRDDDNAGISYKINGGDAKFTNAGTYTLTISVDSNEEYNAATITVTITVKKAPLTLTAKDATITYGDAPTNNGYTDSTDYKGSDSFSDLEGEIIYSYNYSQYAAVGKYTITISGVYSDNYDITFETGVLTVNKKEVSVEWDGDKFVADGNAHAPVATFVNVFGEKVTLTVTISGEKAEDGKAIKAGSYTATVSNTHPNYELKSDTLTHSFEIEEQKVATKKDTIITFTGETEYTYNGSEQEINSGATTNRDDDNEGISYKINGKEAKFTNAGTYTLTISVEPSDTHNGASITVTITVKKAKLTLTAKDATITFGEDPKNNGLDTDKSSGNVGSDTIEDLTKTITFTYDYKKYGNVGEYSIIPGGVTSDNYDITFVPGKLTVNKKDMTVEWTVEKYITDGKTAHAPVGWFRNVYGEIVILTITITGENVTDGKAIKAGEYTARVTSLHPNYNLQNDSTSFTVDDAVVERLTAKLKDGSTKIYTTDTLDTLKDLITVTAYYSDGDQQVISSDFELKWPEGNLEQKFRAGTAVVLVNYTKEDSRADGFEPFEMTVGVIKRDTVITYSGETEYTYDGQEHTLDSGAKTDRLNPNEGITYKIGKDEAKFTGAGKYTLVISVAETDDYNAAELKVTIIVNKADYSLDGITFEDSSEIYDGTEKSIEISGSASGITLKRYIYENVNGGASSSTGATDAGTYKVTVEFNQTDYDNYNPVPTLTAMLVIEKAEAVINVSGIAKELGYTGEEQVVKSGATIVKADEDAVIVYSNNTFTNVPEGGILWVEVTVEEGKNYKAFSKVVAVTINKVTLTLTAQNGSINYGEEPAADGYGFKDSGFVQGESIDDLDGTLTYTYSYSQYGNIGVYDITLGGVSSNNYNIVFRKGQLTVSAVTAEVDWHLEKYVYNTQAHSPTATFTDVYGENVNLKVTVSGSNLTGNEAIKVGQYKATASTTNNNYTLTGDTTKDFQIVEDENNWIKFEFIKDYTVIYGAVPTDLEKLVETLLTEANGYVKVTFNSHDHKIESIEDIIKILTVRLETGDGKTVTATTGVGRYNIVFELKADKAGEYATYELDAKNTNVGRFVIEKKSLTLSWDSTHFEYDGYAHLPTASVSGFVGESDSATINVTAAGGIVSVEVGGVTVKFNLTVNGDFKSVGGHSVSITVEDGNYIINNPYATISISGAVSSSGVVNPGNPSNDSRSSGGSVVTWGVIAAIAFVGLIALIALIVGLKRKAVVINNDEEGFADPYYDDNEDEE